MKREQRGITTACDKYADYDSLFSITACDTAYISPSLPDITVGISSSRA